MNAPTGLLDLYRRPRERPLATFVATVILLAFAHQGYLLGRQVGPVGYLFVAGTAAAAYGVAKCGWAVVNAHVRAERVRRRPDRAEVDGDVTSVDGR